MGLPRTIPWWGWLLIVAGVLAIAVLSFALILRQQGWRELETTVAGLRKAGLGVTPVDLVASAPPVDGPRQERAWALLGTGGLGLNLGTTTWGMAAYAASAKERAKIATETTKLLADTETLRRDWRALCNEGPVTLSVLGWIRQDFPDPETANMADLSRIRFPNLLVMRTLAAALATEARAAVDPRPALRELDRLIAACSPAGSLMDGMIVLALSAIRDEAWLEAMVTRGIDPQSWTAEAPSRRNTIADSFAHERMIFTDGLYQSLIAGQGIDQLSLGFGSSRPGTWERLGDWVGQQFWSVLLPGDLALLLRGFQQGESICRTGSGDSSALERELRLQTWRHPIASISLPNLMESGITANAAEVTARRIRLAALLAWGHRQSGTLPATLSEFSPAALTLAAATICAPEIRYEHLTPTRFRLWSEPPTTSTSLLPLGRVDLPKPTTKRWSGGKNWWLELDLAPETP